jgi:hypothetical protein
VITAVTKTTHYWREHLPPDVKRALEVQARLAVQGAQISGWLRRAGSNREQTASG